MDATNTPRDRKRALIIEPQTLFAPYFVATLESLGLAVVGVVARATGPTLRALRPDIVVVDAGHMPAPPLLVVRGLRRHLPRAHIVVYAHGADPHWAALARSLGADVVIGPRAEERDLLAALAPPLHQSGEWNTIPKSNGNHRAPNLGAPKRAITF